MKSESCKHTWIRVMIIAFVAVLFGWINGRQFFGDERIFLLLYCWGMGFVVGLYDWRIKKMTTKKFLYTMLAFLVVLVAMLVVIYVFDLKDDLFFYAFFVVLILAFCPLLLLNNEPPSSQDTSNQNAAVDDQAIQ